MRQAFRHNDHADLVLLGCIDHERSAIQPDVWNPDLRLLKKHE
jgi:hypothetical protein